MTAFLEAFECPTLESAIDRVFAHVEPLFVDIEHIDDDKCDGLHLQIELEVRWVHFPFTLDEFWDTVNELEAVTLSLQALQALEVQIEDTERFKVSVSMNDELDESEADPTQRREQLSTGLFVQFPTDYPYQRAFDGQRTLGEWIELRFNRLYRGLEVTLMPPLDQLPLNTPVGEVRAPRTRRRPRVTFKISRRGSPLHDET